MSTSNYGGFRILRGSVAKDAQIKAGAGFSVVNDVRGIFEIVFSSKFSGRPTVVATQNYPGNDDIHSNGGDPRDNVVIIAVLEDRFKLKTGGSGGETENRAFEFIAIGPGTDPA
jgi:hypothetical protein